MGGLLGCRAPRAGEVSETRSTIKFPCVSGPAMYSPSWPGWTSGPNCATIGPPGCGGKPIPPPPPIAMSAGCGWSGGGSMNVPAELSVRSYVAALLSAHGKTWRRRHGKLHRVDGPIGVDGAVGHAGEYRVVVLTLLGDL